MISTLMSQRVIRKTAYGPKELIWAHLISNDDFDVFPSAEDVSDQPDDALFAAGSTIVWDGGSLVLWEDQTPPLTPPVPDNPGLA